MVARSGQLSSEGPSDRVSGASCRASLAMRAALTLLATCLTSTRSTGAAPNASEWPSWIDHLGHDVYSYPLWISAQQQNCTCDVSLVAGDRVVECTSAVGLVDWRREARTTLSNSLTYCTAKAWLLEHMPEFDLHFLPNGVAVNSSSMLDDVIAFALMADAAAPWAPNIPLAIKLAYVLPYGAYHESRQNWRPLFFAKFFELVANATTVEEALGRLLAPNVFLDWTSHYWPSSPRQPDPSSTYQIKWSSSTAPPVVSPFEFVAYGYGSCSAWATFVTYVARSVGLPARQAGTPCWNSVYSGTNFTGLAKDNPNVSLCWQGGSAEAGHGGGYLNNHNWAEIYLPGDSPTPPIREAWAFVNVPPGSKEPDAGLCGDYKTFSGTRGCGFDASQAPSHECDHVTGGPGAAMEDHEIFAVTWSKPKDAGGHEGGEVLDVAGLFLTDQTTPLTPLVWAPRLASPLGKPLKDVGMRVVNRTGWYRCKPGGSPPGRRL